MKNILLLSFFLTAAAVFSAEKVFESKARWIWFPAQNSLAKNCYYRWNFNVKEPVKSAVLTCYQDDSGRLFINEQLQKDFSFTQIRKPFMARRYNITKSLKSGRNLFAWHVINDKHSGGLMMTGEIIYESGRKEYIFTDKTWKAVSSAPQGWEKLSFDDSRWTQAWDIGGVMTYPWSAVGAVSSNCLTPEEMIAYQAYNTRLSEVDPAIIQEPQHQLKLVWKNGIPAFVDTVGKQEIPPFLLLGVAGDYPNKTDMLKKFSLFGPRIVEFAMESKVMDLGDGKYDFSKLDPGAAHILRTFPDALISFNARFSSLDSWLEKNPDEIIGYATGPADNKLTKVWKSLDVGGRGRFPSMASELFALELERFAKMLCDHIKKSPWRNRLVMMRVSYGCYSEWHYYGMGGQMPDTGKAMTKVFRKWVKQKYGTVGVLRAAWADNNVTFENVTVPGEKERYGQMLFLRNGTGTSRKVMDYYECHQRVISNLLLRFAAAVKKEMPHLLVGSYYGYVFSMSQFPSEGHTLDFERVLSSPYIDFLSAPSDYNKPSRQMGGVGMPRTIPASFQRHKKLSLNELDLRTHRTKKFLGNDGRNGREDGEVWKRDITISLLNGIGAHIFDMADPRDPAWNNDPDILAAIKSAVDNWQEIRDNKKPSTNRIAVVFNPDEMIWHGYPVISMQSFARTLNDYSMHAVYRSGYTFDLLSMRDLELSKKDYDCLVFINATTLTAGQQKMIKERTRKKGVTAIYTYAPGLVTNKGFSKENMYDLTGIKLDYALEKTPMTFTTLDNKSVGNGKLKEAPRVFSIDKDAEVLGYYPDKKAAAVRKTLPGGATVVFCGVPILQDWMWARLFKDAKLHCVSPDGVAVRWENPFLMVHVRDNGAYRINLPEKAKQVKEMFSKSVIAENTDTVTLHSAGCKTWLLKLEK